MRPTSAFSAKCEALASARFITLMVPTFSSLTKRYVSSSVTVIYVRPGASVPSFQYPKAGFPRPEISRYAVAVRKDQHRAIVSEYHAVGVSADMDDPGERDSTCFSCEYGNFRGRVRVACLAVPRRQRDENPAAVLTRKRLK